MRDPWASKKNSALQSQLLIHAFTHTHFPLEQLAIPHHGREVTCSILRSATGLHNGGSFRRLSEAREKKKFVVVYSKQTTATYFCILLHSRRSTRRFYIVITTVNKLRNKFQKSARTSYSNYLQYVTLVRCSKKTVIIGYILHIFKIL